MCEKTETKTDPGELKSTNVSSGEVKLKTVEEKYADVTLRLVEQYAHTIDPLTPAQEKNLNRKLWLHIVFVVCFINLILFVSCSRYPRSL